MRHHLQQGAILALTSLSMLIIALPAPADRWGFLIGLFAQPVWLAVTWRAGQWGMFANSIIYTAALALGLYTHWT